MGTNPGIIISGGRGGRTTFIPDASPFADIAARDTWATANLDQLFNNSTQFNKS